jgi:hypothetical protein
VLNILHQVKRDNPYGHPIFVAVMSDVFFKDPINIAKKYDDCFYSSLPGAEDELEISPQMLAFVATVVCYI